MFHLIFPVSHFIFFFFFNDTATTEIYTLSLHDALPISHHLRLAAGGDPEPHDEEEARFFHRPGTMVQSMTRIIARSNAALSASDKCMPIRLPPSPTVMPLKARRPSADMLKSPITRPRAAGGALICTSVCAMA